jgi:hypothetical protein
MAMEFERKNKEPKGQEIGGLPSDQSGSEGSGEPKELKDLAGPEIDRAAEQKKLASGGEVLDTRSESNDMPRAQGDGGTPKDRNRELWR